MSYLKYPGGWFNIKMPSYQYRRIHCGHKIDGTMQERCNSIANALELCLSCINPLRWSYHHLISIMGFPTLVKQHLYIESGPWSLTLVTEESDSAGLWWLAWSSVQQSSAFIQQVVRNFTTWFCEVSKLWNQVFKLPYHSNNWQAPQQHYCKDAHQISEQSNNSKLISDSFEVLWDLGWGLLSKIHIKFHVS